LSLFVRKYVIPLVIVTFLHQPAASLLSLLPLVGKFGGFAPGTDLARAQEAVPVHPEAPSVQPEVLTAPTGSQPPEAPSIQPEVLTAPTGSQPPEGQPEEEKKPTAPGAPSTMEKLKMVPDFIELLHGELSRELLSTAVWLDSYFGDERYVVEQNKSYVRFRYEIFQEERANTSFRPAVDLRFVLPQLEQKAHITFSAEPNVTPADTGTPVIASTERIATTAERNLTTALQYFFKSTPAESFIIRTGVQFSQGTIVLFTAPRYRLLIPLPPWDLRFTEEATYRTDTGWQSETIVDLERKLPRDFFFRTSLDALWLAGSKGYFYALSFSLREVFNATNALDYEWVNSYQTHPVYELTEVAFRIRYRHSFWREWLFYEVAPQIRFPRTGNFDLIPGILFRIETYFGRQS
jgi:hypothetical protein